MFACLLWVKPSAIHIHSSQRLPIICIASLRASLPECGKACIAWESMERDLLRLSQVDFHAEQSLKDKELHRESFSIDQMVRRTFDVYSLSMSGSL